MNKLRKKFLRTILPIFLVIFTILPNAVSVQAADTPVQNVSEQASKQVQVFTNSSIQNAPVQHSIPELLSAPGERVIYFSEKGFQHNYSIASIYGIVDLAAYHDWNFTSKSAPEFVNFDQACNSISLIAVCDGDEIDSLSCEITDLTYGGQYSQSLIFDADGSVTTYPITLPAGRYKVKFLGDVNILKTEALVVFSAVDESIFSTLNSSTVFRYQRNLL